MSGDRDDHTRNHLENLRVYMTEKPFAPLTEEGLKPSNKLVEIHPTGISKKTDSQPTIAKHLYCSLNLDPTWVVSKITKLKTKFHLNNLSERVLYDHNYCGQSPLTG